MSAIGSINGSSFSSVNRAAAGSGSQSFRYFPVLKRGPAPPNLPGEYRIKGGPVTREPSDLRARMDKMIRDGDIKAESDYFDYTVIRDKGYSLG